MEEPGSLCRNMAQREFTVLYGGDRVVRRVLWSRRDASESPGTSTRSHVTTFDALYVLISNLRPSHYVHMRR